jgi:hypothetical protein
MKLDRRHLPTIARSKLAAGPTSTIQTPPNRRRSAALLLLMPLGVFAFGVLGEPASATTVHPGGRVQVYEVAPSLASNTANDVITGAIADHGKDYEGVAGNPTINKIVLSKGSFEISTARMTPKPPTANPRTCSTASSFTATVPIINGTGRGAYTGISGEFKVTITQAGIAPRRMDHTCNLGPNVTPVAGVSWTRGSGTVSFK